MKWSSQRELDKLKEATKKKVKKKKSHPIPMPKIFKSYKVYLMSKDWTSLKKRKLNQVGNSCQVCNSSKNLHIHHRTYTRVYNEFLNDLTVLCCSCHLLFHQQNWSEEKIESEVYKLIEKDLGYI